MSAPIDPSWIIHHGRAYWTWYQDGLMVYVNFGSREYRQVPPSYYEDRYVRGVRRNRAYPHTALLSIFYPLLVKVDFSK